MVTSAKVMEALVTVRGVKKFGVNLGRIYQTSRQSSASNNQGIKQDIVIGFKYTIVRFMGVLFSVNTPKRVL